MIVTLINIDSGMLSADANKLVARVAIIGLLLQLHGVRL